MSSEPNRRAGSAIVLLGIGLVAFNLRPAIASVPPLLELIRADLGLSYAAVSLLTAIPVFCMGVFAFATPTVIRRIGRERGLFWGVVLIGTATAARVAADHSIVLFGTTILVGIGIAVTQTLLPSLVSVYFPKRVAFATGLYTAGLATGAAVSSGVTVPLYQFVGSWELALALWSILAGFALLTLLPIYRSGSDSRDVRSNNQAVTSSMESGSISWRNRDVWAMVFILGGINVVFYSTLTWFAPRYVDLGFTEHDAGIVLMVFLVAQLLGIASISVFADRFATRLSWFALMLGLVGIGAFGTAYVPEAAPWLWAAVFGTGAGGTFTLSMTLPVEYGAKSETVDRLSSMVLGGGYLLGAVGPFIIGALRDFGGGYDTVFAAMILLTAAIFGAAFRFELSVRSAGKT